MYFFYIFVTDTTGEDIPLRKGADDDDDAESDDQQPQQVHHQQSSISDHHSSTSQLFIDREKSRLQEGQHSQSACDINSNNNNPSNNNRTQDYSLQHNRTSNLPQVNVYSNKMEKLENSKSFLKMEQELNAMSANSLYDIDYSIEMDIEK